MNLKNPSLVCCTASIAIATFSSPAQATLKHQFFYGVVRQLQDQNSPGEKDALNRFATMDDRINAAKATICPN